IGEATYSHGNMQSEGSSVSHVPGTEGEANGSNKPFLNTLNATKADNKDAKPDTNLNDTSCIIPSKELHDSEMAVFREPGQTHSKFFKRSEEIKSQSSREPSTGRKLIQFSSKRLASVHLNETRLGDNAKDSEVGGKVAGWSEFTGKGANKMSTSSDWKSHQCETHFSTGFSMQDGQFK
ncbi:hypothetical protein NL676_012796, partial [Syzygium grande]